MKLKAPKREDLFASLLERVTNFWSFLASQFESQVRISIVVYDVEQKAPVFVVGDIAKQDFQSIIAIMPEDFTQVPVMDDIFKELKKERPDDGSH